jgi:hypothetical protein
MSNVKFCWLCGNKLWGNHSELLVIDGYSKTLHKKCAKEIKREYNFQKDKDGSYHSMEWIPSEIE